MNSKRTFLFESLPYGMQCHASNLLIANHRQIITFFAGASEGHPDTGIWYVSGDGAGWDNPRCMVKLGMIPHWNPVMMRSKELILLFFKTGIKPSSWTTHLLQIGGKSYLRSLSDKDGVARGPVRSSVLVASNGDWLAPASHEVVVREATLTTGPIVIWDSFVDRSKDEGQTWRKTPFLPYDRKRFGTYGGTIQPTLWESENGKIHMLLRSTIGSICRSDSEDYGKTWSSIEPIQLPNNNSGVDVAKNPKTGILALVYNPVSENWGVRTPLSVAFSKGDGRQWSKPVAIESGSGSFSYPSIQPDGDGFAVTYTWNRLRIAHLRFAAWETDDGYQTDIEEVATSKPAFV